MANFNYAQTIMGGRLTSDPELKTTPSGVSVTSFTVAVNRKGKGEETRADFFHWTAWRQTAEFITRYFRKGSNIFLVGEPQTREWERDGQKRSVTEFVADRAYFVDSKAEMPETREAAYIPDAYNVKPEDAPQFEDLGDEETLPF